MAEFVLMPQPYPRAPRNPRLLLSFCLKLIREDRCKSAAKGFTRRFRPPSACPPSVLGSQLPPAPTVHPCRRCPRLRPLAGRCRPSKLLSAHRDHCRSRSDRKSTRLNSSHLGISYAVFCLKKK